MKYFYLKKNFSNNKIEIKKFSVGFAKKKIKIKQIFTLSIQPRMLNYKMI